jgi:hypothetical protein
MKQKMKYINTGANLSHIDERSYEESKFGG